ncbi:MAG TPA: trypsin-like peptidase domain-containing protein [Coriobacteriia bacterium]|nr:trypsin-like peptidase domain-containing protein [Coriobacteriia bacterium]
MTFEEPAYQVPREPRRSGGCGLLATAGLGALIGGIIAAVLVAGAFVALYGMPGESETLVVSEPTSTAVPAPIDVDGGDLNFAEAVAMRVTPSVVSIAVEQSGIDPFSGRRVTQRVGNGSGVIIRSDGHILTNDHVIAGADGLYVTIGMDELPATVVGRDPSSDLAVIRVERTGLPAAELGSSAGLRVGQSVVAIGSPFGLDKTVTTGIVSALGRTSFAESAEAQLTAYTSLIQTDAAINPGNSGGALADAEGRVVGINTLIQSPSGAVGAPQSAGIGFAIPIDYARQIAEELIATGRATHPYMGVSTVTITQPVAVQYDLPVDAGALVQEVQPDSPAEAGGLLRGDIIVRIAGITIRSTEDVFTAIRGEQVGATVEVIVYRDDAQQTYSVTLGSDADRR